MKKVLLCICVLMTGIALDAQDPTTRKDQWTKKDIYASIDVFSSINPFMPRYRAGFVANLGDEWKIGLDLGYGDRKICYTSVLDHFNSGYRLWEVRPEIYRIIYSRSDLERYLSLELLYVRSGDEFFGGYYYPDEGGEISFDHADLLRQKFAFNINIGQFVYIRRSFGMNVYIGGGLRLRNSSFDNIENPRPTETFVDMFDFYEYREKEGLDFGPNLSLGFNLLF